jgi:hypothetical protein
MLRRSTSARSARCDAAGAISKGRKVWSFRLAPHFLTLLAVLSGTYSSGERVFH